MTSAPLADIEAEAVRLVDGLAEHGQVARLIGGLAVASHQHGPVPAPLLRSYGDIDIVVPPRASGPFSDAMESLGYVPNKRFNNLRGDRRMLFYDEPNERQVDVFVGRFDMCHGLELRDRLDTGTRTLFPSDLLLTKLQVVEINQKDLLDALTIVLTHDLGEDTDDALDGGRLVAVTAADWGWFTTFTDNLRRLPDLAVDVLEEETAVLVADRVRRLQEAIEVAPKPLRWKARAKIGRKVKWYELPEEVGQNIVTR